MTNRDSSSRSQSPLAQQEKLWSGHPVAVVLGETEAAAEDGVVAVDVEYEPLLPVIDPISAMELEAPAARISEKDTTSEIAGGGAHAAVSEDEEGEEEKDKEEEKLSKNIS